jgi:hypothetical protein
MITWFGWTGHLGQGLLMEDYSFEFWIFISFESWWCDLGLPKEGRYGEKDLRHNLEEVRIIIGTL